MVTIKFTKTFTRGVLAGISIEETMGHVDFASASRWVDGIRANGKRGALDYVISRVVDSDGLIIHNGNCLF